MRSILIIFMLLLLTACVPTIMQQRSVQTCVTDKDAVSQGDNGNQYRVYTDTGTYMVTDSVSIWRFNSADVYADLEPGKCYELLVGGSRMPMLSQFPNIISYEQMDR